MKYLALIVSMIFVASVAFAWPHAIKPGGGGGVGGGDGDEVQENGNNRVDWNFTDSAHVEWASTGASPSVMTALVVNNALDFTELAAAMALDTDTAIAIGDNETLTITGVDTGTDGAAEVQMRIDFTLDQQASGSDTWTGFLVTSTNDRLLADSDTNNFVEFRTVATTNNGNYTHLLNLVHGENLAGTLLNGLRIAGVTANSMVHAIDISQSTPSLGGINLGLQSIYSSGQLSIGHTDDTDNITFESDGPGGFVRIDGDTIEAAGGLTGPMTGIFNSETTDPAEAGAIRLANLDLVNWESAPASGTEIGIRVDAGEQFEIVNSVGGIGLVTTTATECISLKTGDASCATTGGCDLVNGDFDTQGTNFDYKRASFDASADERATWIFETPTNMTGLTGVVTVAWLADDVACDGGATRDVCWTLDGDSFADAGVWNTGALGGTLVSVTDNCATDGSLQRVALPTFTHSMGPDEVGVLVIARDVDGTDGAGCNAAGDDDLAANAVIVSARFCFEVDNVFSGE